MSAVEPDKCAQCLEHLVPRFHADLWRYLRFLGAAATEVDDLVQETFLAVFRSSFVYRTDREALSYLRTTARRQFMMARRARGRELDTVSLDAAEYAWAEMERQHCDWDHYLAALEDCLSGLQGRTREALELYYRQGFGQQEVGEKIGLEREGVKTLLRRAREAA